MYASCAAREGAGVVLLGPPGSGKSDLLLRMLDLGFELVGDDRIEVTEGWARPAEKLAGLLEVRGLGILRLPYCPETRLALAVTLGKAVRMPAPERHILLDLPLVSVEPFTCSAASRVARALDCATGRVRQVAGAFAA